MAKLRVTVTAVMEYEPDPENYPDCEAPEEILALDLEVAEDDTLMFLSGVEKWAITGEVLKEDEA
jgi:hypothetical protein